MTLFSQELWVLVIFYYIKQLDFYSSLIFNNLFFFLQHLSLWYSKTGEVTCIQYQKLQNCFYWCTKFDNESNDVLCCFQQVINCKLHFDKYLKYIYTPWNEPGRMQTQLTYKTHFNNSVSWCWSLQVLHQTLKQSK